MLTNHHTHCDFCDGTTSAAAMADAAQKAGFSVLGFTSHAPLPFSTAWNMDPDDMTDYVRTIRGLAATHAPALEILAGLEVDYIEGLCGPADGRFSAFKLDYTIGSTHFVTPSGVPATVISTPPSCLDQRGEPTFGFTVDEPEADFDRHLEEFYAGDSMQMVADYYTALTACIRTGGFDILGHFDLIRKNNHGQSKFSEDSALYREAAMQAVEALRGTEIIVEVNTGAMTRGYTTSPYPALWILKELKTRGVPICVNADAHAPSHLLIHREAALRLASEAGYRVLTIPTKLGRQEIPLG
jgi:histidinol-phosphatase (PHP family)